MEIAVIMIIVVGTVAAVMLPLLRRQAGEQLERPASPAPDDAALEREIGRYRAALRAGTLCRRCGTANAEGSRYCAECGRRLRVEAA